ncbi:transient receptor potential cation channel subfamily A member 1-like [Oncorhynchus kisutch]|uniref:transient receptor potential cation channel subfamily A member 1-like n=1 Tax=Oncorhynchus kisutch TaxID=8019 RepID=UPI0012DD74CA|nr:transient receptor potential cation channel subfamily A member 1-like [Oncorhynchus kisutch]
MQFTKEVARQNSSYKCVIEDATTSHKLNAKTDVMLAATNLFECARGGDVSQLEGLVRRNPGVLREQDDSGASLVHHAAGAGNIPVIRFICSITHRDEWNLYDDEGSMPLHWAVERNQPESCRALLELGVEPNVLNKALMSPLHLAVSYQHNHLVKLLLSHYKTESNLQGCLGNTPVMLACSINNTEALSILLKHGAQLSSQNKLGHFAIHTAAFAGAKKAMEVILKAGEEMGHSIEEHINVLDESCSSPLHMAVRGGNMDVIKFCIQKGAKIDQQQVDRSTALHFACSQGATEAVKLMLSSYSRVDSIINLPDGACQTPLHRSTIFDHTELAEYLISKGADIDYIDCKGLSPLLLATNCGAWRSVALLLSKGANVNIKDKSGCNFLHLAILQPKGLKNLTGDILQHSSMMDLLSTEDNEGCTPLHYACRLGIHESVKNILVLQVSLDRKSKDKKSALHFAAQYGRINTCQRLLETITDSRLLNEGDERGLTPLHLASGGGHAKVVELLLRKGALFHSDYKGWTCLHHAAAEGYTQTMKIVLGTNIKLLDKLDEDGSTALHVAAREGQVAAVRLLLQRGAEISLNKSHASFFHEALQHRRKDVVNAIIDSDRCSDTLRTFKHDAGKRCPVLELVDLLPESCKHLLDCCIRESKDDDNSPDYHIEYNFQWLQAPIALKKHAKTDESLKVQPLAALNAMVNNNRIELLTHPVCKKYLEMKWVAYGSTAHLLNLFVYLLGLLPLTHLIVSLRPSLDYTGPDNTTAVTMVPISFREQNSFLSICMVMVLVMNIYSMGKEVMQMYHQRLSYLKDISNIQDWFSIILSLLFIIALFVNAEGSWHWQAGALAIIMSWVNFLLYLQRFEHFGIYVVMFREIARTLFKILLLFFFLMLAFALVFYALMLNQEEFERLDLSVIQIFVMMVGELNYQSNFLDMYLHNRFPFPFITFYLLVIFIIFMPILLMNMMIGLAVGDIAEVQRSATLKRIAMQIELHTNLEEKMPYWLLKRVDQSSITIYPNRKCSKFWSQGEANEVRTHLLTNSSTSTSVEAKLHKQKQRLKEISSVLEKQHDLMKLMIQKMEITSEADEHDGPTEVNGHRQMSNWGRAKCSKWIPLMKAIKNKNLNR